MNDAKLTSLIAANKSLFAKKFSLDIPDDWLSQCVEFLLENFPNESNTSYNDMIYKQLLDFDLNTISTQCLPSKLFETNSGFIEGTYFLQINLCIDANQSYFSHLQRLRGEFNDNVLVDADVAPSATQFENKNNVRKNRMLAFHLTDGSHSIKAFEYRPISFITDDILPGTKAQLHGSIQFRNQVLFLGPENIKIIGGCVEDFSTNENLISVLEHELKEKLASEQTVMERERSVTFESSSVSSSNNVDSIKSSYSSSNRQQQQQPQQSYGNKNHHIKQEQTSQVYKQNTQLLTATNQSKPCQNNFTSKPVLVEDDDDDDQLLMNCNFDQLEMKKQSSMSIKVEKDCYSSSGSSSSIKRPPSSDYLPGFADTRSNFQQQQQLLANKKKPKIERLDEYLDSDEYADDFKPPNRNTVQTKAQSTSSNVTINKQQSVNSSNNGKMMDSERREQCLVAKPNQNGNGVLKMENLSSVVQKSFLVNCCFNKKPSIEGGQELTSSKPSLSTCCHLIHGHFVTLTSALKQFKLNWYQECIISDGTHNLEVYIGNEPIAQLLEMTCKEAKELFKKSKESTSKAESNEYFQKFELHRKRCQTKLEKMTAHLYLKYDFEREKFCVFKLDHIELNR